MRFKLQRQQKGQGYYFEIQSSGNFQTLCTSEIYEDIRTARKAVDLIMREAGTAEVVDRVSTEGIINEQVRQALRGKGANDAGR
jgi:uncharacterized protein YegP (UPF0339 family)